MDSDADDTRSQTTQNPDVPTPQKHKKHRKKQKGRTVPTVPTAETLKIVPIVANEKFGLEPNVKRATSSAASESRVTGQLTGQEMEEKNTELHTLYGTNKAIRASKKILSLKQDDGPDAQKVLEDKLKHVVPNKEALEGTRSQVSVRLPPFNQSATTPQEAYPLDKIIGTGEWDSLRDIYDLLQGGKKIPEDKYPKFVSNRIHKFQGIEEEDKLKLSGMFSYITHLIKYKDKHTMDGLFTANGHRFPKIIFHKFKSMFPTKSKTDLTDIAKDLRMSSITLRTHYENLGCKLSRENNALLATLPVPLKFPELRQRQKRKR